MIRFFVLTGLVGGALVAYLTTAGVGPISQLPPPESLLTIFREEGLVPLDKNLEEDETAEEAGVFEVPEADELRLEAAQAAYDKMTGAMDMGQANAGAMDMAAGGTMDMATAGTMDMGEGGLLVREDGAYGREIELTMSEWSFDQMDIEVKAGERIKFTVRNTGQIPHEFMFMSPPLMQAVAYRATRADWSLFEHEALYEKALVLPGGAFSFVLTVTEPGAWMFMCMLPYHMQMGMMGQMATKGMAMDM